MELGLRTRLLLAILSIVGPGPLWKLSLTQLRALDAPPPRNVVTRLIFGRRHQVWRVEDLDFPGRRQSIGARIYRPIEQASAAALLYFHGGGFITGNLDSHDGLCRRIAAKTGRVVISVDYRRAPEHPFPAALEDCVDGLRWVSQNAEKLGVRRDDIAIGGDSAGANLAAVVAQTAMADGNLLISKQLLIYGSYDVSRNYLSATNAPDAPIISKADIDHIVELYLNAACERTDPRVSPLFGSLNGLPPALVICGESDPLLDESIAYAEALAQTGVSVELKTYPKQIHGFLLFAGLCERADEGYSDIGRFLSIGSAIVRP